MTAPQKPDLRYLEQRPTNPKILPRPSEVAKRGTGTSFAKQKANGESIVGSMHSIQEVAARLQEFSKSFGVASEMLSENNTELRGVIEIFKI